MGILYPFHWRFQVNRWSGNQRKGKFDTIFISIFYFFIFNWGYSFYYKLFTISFSVTCSGWLCGTVSICIRRFEKTGSMKLMKIWTVHQFCVEKSLLKWTRRFKNTDFTVLYKSYDWCLQVFNLKINEYKY